MLAVKLGAYDIALGVDQYHLVVLRVIKRSVLLVQIVDGSDVAIQLVKVKAGDEESVRESEPRLIDVEGKGHVVVGVVFQRFRIP